MQEVVHWVCVFIECCPFKRNNTHQHAADCNAEVIRVHVSGQDVSLFSLKSMLFDPVTIWPCPPLIVTQVLPSWPLIVWIPKARLHWGRDPNAVQHCVMGALWPLGALQQEHVHCEIRGLSDLRSQTHELSCTLVNTHTLPTCALVSLQRLTLLCCVQPDVWAARSLVERAPSAMGRLRGAAP